MILLNYLIFGYTFNHICFHFTSLPKKCQYLYIFRRAYNLNDIKISPIAVSQVYKPAGTMDENGDIFSAISLSDLFNLVKTYDFEFKPRSINKPFSFHTSKQIIFITNRRFILQTPAKRFHILCTLHKEIV